MRRVVITGIGAVTPIGNTADEFWQGIKENRCGIDYIQKVDVSDIDVFVDAEVKDFNPKEAIGGRDYRRMDTFAQYAVAAALQALKQSGYDIEANPERVGTIVGAGIGGSESYEAGMQAIIDRGPSRVNPLSAAMLIGNMAAGNIALTTGAQGEAKDVVTACATGTDSIGEAYLKIKHGYLDAAFAGGTEGAITRVTLAAFRNLTALSPNEDPKTASRPFDKDRDGFVFGEGSGVLFLETLESAQERGAHIIAEIVGYGSNNDAYHLTSPRPDGSGAGKAFLKAMEMGNVEPTQIDYINAHGTSTPTNDTAETKSIKYALGDHAYDIAVSSIKGHIGHLLGGAGGVEAIVTAKALEEGFIPATLGLENPDEECDLDYVPGQGRQQDIRYAMSTSLGFGGHNAVLLMKKWEGQ